MADKIELASKAKNKKVDIIKDDNGYYKVRLGAFNTYNHSGMFYHCDNKTLEFLKSDKSVIGRRLKNGMLRSEYQHPDYKGMSGNEQLRRALTINMDRVCGHIKEVTFNITDVTEKGWNKLPIIVIDGWVKPSGPYGKNLQEALDNPDENVAFSYRGPVMQKVVGTTLVRYVKDISTWDYVFEPGVKIATQWNAAGMEHRTSDDVICLNGVCSTKFKKCVAGMEELSNYNITEVIKIENEEKTIFDRW